MPKFPNPYEVTGKLVAGNGSLIPSCSLSNRSLLPSLTVFVYGPLQDEVKFTLISFFQLKMKMKNTMIHLQWKGINIA